MQTSNAKTKKNPKSPKTVKKPSMEELRSTIEGITIALKQTQKIVGDIGNRFGDFSEVSLVPDLKEKFRKYNYSFEKTTWHVSIEDYKNDIHAEIDAMLENGNEAMIVEVKSTLKRNDVDDHVRRMEKVRRYFDSKNDKRKFFGAIAAMVVDKDTRLYALREGFYLIEPSGESVRIVAPGSAAKSW